MDNVKFDNRYSGPVNSTSTRQSSKKKPISPRRDTNTSWTSQKTSQNAPNIVSSINRGIIGKKYIINLITQKNGTLVNTYANTDPVINERIGPISFDNSVSESMGFEIKCSAGHVWVTRAADIHEWCPTCCLTQSGAYIVDDNAPISNYSKYSNYISLKCAEYGHRVTEYAKKIKNYNHLKCKSCVLLDYARDKLGDTGLMLDTKIVNDNQHSRLRFHCNKVVHHHLCGNPNCVEIRSTLGKVSSHSLMCTNKVTCNNEFYATPNQLHVNHSYIYDCNSGHKPSLAQAGGPNALITLEAIFNVRFDDEPEFPPSGSISNYYLTGYNKLFKIAVLCQADPRAVSCQQNVTNWCNANDVNLIIINHDINRATAVREHIVKELFVRDLIPYESIEDANEDIKAKIHTCNDTYGYVTRCIF